MGRAVFEAAYSHRSLANECDRGAAADTFRFITERLTDKRPGSEWFWAVDKQGAPIPGKPIVEPWKCPFHNGRMCMELMRCDPEIYI